MIRFRPGLVLLMAAIASCVRESPTDVSVQPSLVITMPDRYLSILDSVRDVRIRITPPPGPVRDTIVAFTTAGSSGGRFRTRLRPDEGVAGTLVEAALRYEDLMTALYGRTLLGADGGWPTGPATMELRPAIVIAATASWDADPGDRIDLIDLARLESYSGIPILTEAIDWSSKDESVLRIEGDQAVALATGSTALIARFRLEVDTVEVTVR